MKKVAITGGTSGIGFEIKKQLEAKGILVNNFSRTNGYDLINENNIEKLVLEIKNNKYDALFLNAGQVKKGIIGNLNYKDIESIFKINAISNIKIINDLFNEIKSGQLKLIVTLSTAVYINGVGEAIYNSSKKALNEFIISANTELESLGSKTKIFRFLPHFIAGTKSTNGSLDSLELKNIVSGLLKEIKNNKDIFIPKYNEVYKRVFDAYKDDPIAQGLQSLEYRRRRDGK